METLGQRLEFLKCLWNPFSHKIGYMKDLKRNFEELQRHTQRVQNRMEDINREIKNTGKKRTRECEGWFEDAERIQTRRKQIEEEYCDQRRWFSYFFSCMSLGRRVAELISDAINIMEESEFKGGMMIDEPLKTNELPTPIIEVNTSIKRTLQKILRFIEDESVKRIGIWGMGGVGKTTVMKILNNNREIFQMFEIIIWVTVSKEGSCNNVQKEVAQRLYLERKDGDSDDAFKSKLFQTLKAKKFLLLLDDVWDKIDLDEVGIPSLGKIVLSTRQRKVCNKMKTDKEIKVEVLSKEEAWVLFSKEVGEVVDSPNIEPFARGVAKECCGLPLAIVVLGGALRNEDDIHVWRNALKELSSSVSFEIEDMEAEVFRRLKYSFDRLKNENTKKCFLYCALYPEDHEIVKTELIERWRSDGLIGGWGTLDEERDKGFTIVKELIDASLLEKCSSDNDVKMHDVIRDLALRITSLAKEEDYRSLVKAGIRLTEAPKAEEWEHVNRISLIRNDLTNLPEKLNCPLLSTLLLQNNFMLKEVPFSFFEHMCALQVLDLSRTGIASLSPSICSLVNLRGIYIDWCKRLRIIPSEVGALSKLEVLHMRGKNQVQYLPCEMGELSCLRDLQVELSKPSSDGEEEKQAMQMIPDGLLSKLSQLEQLSIYIDKDHYERWNECAEFVSRDLAILKKLTHLNWYFAREEHLKRFVQESLLWEKRNLTSFRFFVGQHVRRRGELRWSFKGVPRRKFLYVPYDEKHEVRRMLLYKGGNSFSPAIGQVLTRTEVFLLEGHVVALKLSEFGMGNMNLLKECIVVECKEIETIVDGDEVNNSVVLPSLESMSLYHLPKLRSIWEGPLPPPEERRRCFNNLTDLFFDTCPKLKVILSRGLIQHLSNLESLAVTNCSDVKEIFTTEEAEDNMDATKCQSNLLPKLRNLYLEKLPTLTSICNKGLLSMSWPSLESIRIIACPNTKKLPLGIGNAPKLRRIHCVREWWKALEWEDHAIKEKLQPKLQLSG